MITKYRLKKDLPNLNAGVIFEHREYDSKHPDRGNMGCGVMILGWLNGSTQGGWCGDTFVLPGQLAENKEWFEKLTEVKDSKELEKQDILNEIEKLSKRVALL